jgi:hypothetical protein
MRNLRTKRRLHVEQLEDRCHLSASEILAMAGAVADDMPMVSVRTNHENWFGNYLQALAVPGEATAFVVREHELLERGGRAVPHFLVKINELGELSQEIQRDIVRINSIVDQSLPSSSAVDPRRIMPLVQQDQAAELPAPGRAEAGRPPGSAGISAPVSMTISLLSATHTAGTPESRRADVGQGLVAQGYSLPVSQTVVAAITPAADAVGETLSHSFHLAPLTVGLLGDILPIDGKALEQGIERILQEIGRMKPAIVRRVGQQFSGWVLLAGLGAGVWTAWVVRERFRKPRGETAESSPGDITWIYATNTNLELLEQL